MRARELGVLIGTGRPGPMNAITDVAGVRVGHTTLIEGEGPLVVGQGPVRTGVTVVLPHEGSVWEEPVFAGCHRLNRNGELTGLEWVRESGLLTSPIALTNTHSVGVVRDALVAAEIRERAGRDIFWGLPVAGETWDGHLNDINGFHVKPEHVASALESASRSAPGSAVREGNVGGGTGMICHGFKGGIGTASRVVSAADDTYTVGVLVQANYGRRERLRVDGVAVGERIAASEVPLPGPLGGAADGRPSEAQSSQPLPGAGSIIVVVATDAPLLPHQCTRLAQRPGLGVARMGGVGEHSSGDLFLAFATGNRRLPAPTYGVSGEVTTRVSMLSDAYITPLFDAVIEATEEAIVNALLAAETMTGRDGVTAYRLEPARLVQTMAGRGH